MEKVTKPATEGREPVPPLEPERLTAMDAAARIEAVVKTLGYHIHAFDERGDDGEFDIQVRR
jgi:hypothetical protein